MAHSSGELESTQSNPPSRGAVEDSSRTPFPASDSTEGAAPPAEPSPDDLTVISSSTPVTPRPHLAHLHPRELGRALEGHSLGHYRLESFIGGGGMGAVFRAQDTELNRTVAVKVLATPEGSDEETRLRFRNEAQAAARLDHPNIARVHYVGEDDGVRYIVFEYIEGINMRDLVARDGPLPLDAVLHYTLQIAQALDHASDREVVHRDIKPSNILVMPDGQAKLVDMGLARSDQVEMDEDLTASGVTLGTFDYIAPEQARDPRAADARSDIYSLGCTMFYMLCARPPFPEGTMLQKLLRHQGEQPPSLRTLRPDVPAAFRELIDRMLAKSPDDRFATPGQLIGALLRAADQAGLSVAVQNAYLASSPRSPVSGMLAQLPWALPLAMLLAVVAAIEVLGRGEAQLLPLPPSQAVKERGASSFPAAAPAADPAARLGPTSDPEAAAASGMAVTSDGPGRGNPRGLPPRPQ